MSKRTAEKIEKELEIRLYPVVPEGADYHVFCCENVSLLRSLTSGVQKHIDVLQLYYNQMIAPRIKTAEGQLKVVRVRSEDSGEWERNDKFGNGEKVANGVACDEYATSFAKPGILKDDFFSDYRNVFGLMSKMRHLLPNGLLQDCGEHSGALLDIHKPIQDWFRIEIDFEDIEHAKDFNREKALATLHEITGLIWSAKHPQIPAQKKIATEAWHKLLRDVDFSAGRQFDPSGGETADAFRIRYQEEAFHKLLQEKKLII